MLRSTSVGCGKSAVNETFERGDGPGVAQCADRFAFEPPRPFDDVELCNDGLVRANEGTGAAARERGAVRETVRARRRGLA